MLVKFGQTNLIVLFSRNSIELGLVLNRFFLGGADDAIGVMRRRVDGVELELFCLGSIDNVVFGAAGHHYRVAVRDIVACIINDDLATSLLEAEELVIIVFESFLHIVLDVNKTGNEPFRAKATSCGKIPGHASDSGN